MIDSDRRIGIEASQVMCTKLPGAACAAHLGAARRSTNCSPSYASCESTRACSRKMVPRLPLMPERACASPAALAEYFGQYRHAHRHPVAHLVADDRLRAVCHL